MRFRKLAAFAALGALAVVPVTDAVASSHREAPFITKSPKVDGTDFYMFRSYETTTPTGNTFARDEFTTMIANYIPLQNQYGGPNFFTMDPEALYEIHVENTGDGVEDITFQFRFNNSLNDTTGGNTGFTLPLGGGQVSVPLANYGAVSTADANRNVLENYTLKVIRGPRRTGTAQDVTRVAGPGPTDTKVFVKPMDNVGSKTFPNYENYARTFIYDVDIPGCTPPAGKKARVFVGQRQEGFAVLLGNIFDLVNALPAQLTEGNGGTGNTLTTGRGSNLNPIRTANVTSISMEIPTSCLVKSATEPVIGGWSTASVRQARVVNPSPTFTKPSREGGAWTQVSRLGMPLVNEVVIGIKDKDKFNATEPKDDLANFGPYVQNSTLAALIEILFGAGTAPAPTTPNRPDLVAAFVTGVPNANQIPNGLNANLVPSEMLRLNTNSELGLKSSEQQTTFAPSATFAANPAGTFSGAQRTQLGAAYCFVPSATATDKVKVFNGAAPNCDPTGFPNGRRPGDDVVDVAIRVVEGYLLNIPAEAGGGSAPWGDLIQQRADQFDSVFPYLKSPTGGT